MFFMHSVTHRKWICPIVFCALMLLGPAGAGAEAPDSLAALRQAVALSPRDGDAWVRLGYAYLTVDNLKLAEDAFKKGERYARSAAAYNGRGLVMMKKGISHARNAFPYFRKALGVDPGYVEAQLNIARTHTLLRESDAEIAYRKAILIDPSNAPVYLELAQWFLDRGYESYHEDLQALYKKYLELRPDDEEGHYGLALNYTEQQAYGAALDVARAVIARRGVDARWTVLMAQAHAARGESDRALSLFRRYLGMIAPEERALYEDLSLVAFRGELVAFRAVPEAEREAFLVRFWRKRDPLLVSGGQARQVEHYRRVWYARTHFAKRAHPWDKRGEIYIRYGEPDYRSRSNFPNAPPPPAVENVKVQIAYEISSAMTEEGPIPLPNETMIGPAYPVSDTGDKPWEAWVYVNVGGGVEFSFVDEVMNGRFEFPLPPIAGELPIRAVSALWRNHPAALLQAVVGRMPEKFDVPPGVEPLGFYYDIAQFRGEAGQTSVEVYFGVPPEQVALEGGRGYVERTLVITDAEGEVVSRDQEPMRFAVGDSSQVRKGAFVPEIASASVPPGSYKLAVQVRDQQSGKWGVYAQELLVPAFGDSLGMSDLAMAWRIGDEGMGDRFRKGEVWVLPMPSRHYMSDQGVFVYYEVYNLTRDAFGQTRYRVDYAIRQDMRRGVGVFGALGTALQKAISSGKPQVAVGYEREGREVWERMYLELDARKVKPGLNQIEVTVTDLVSGQAVSRYAMFQLSEAPREMAIPREPEPDRMDRMMPGRRR